MIKLFFLLFTSILLANAQLLEFNIHSSKLLPIKHKNINILDAKELRFEPLNGIHVNELSALAYKDNKLYALSNLGYLYHFNIRIKKNKIKTLELINAVELKNKKGDKLKKSSRDTEGMVLVNNKLYISFERKPKVDIFSLDGKKIKNYKIPKELRDIDNYQGKNKALESIAYSKKYEVITAPEVALKNEDEDYHTLYSKNKTWSFKAHGKLSALEFMDKHSVLALERKFNHLTRRRVTRLTKVYLDKCDKEICKSKVMAVLDSKKGWNLDNFEGLTKVSKNRFLLVSDDNGGILQKTLLVLFEIVED